MIGYLHNQKKKIYTQDNLQQIKEFTKSSSGKYFNVFFPNGKEADKTMRNSYFSSDLVDNIILKEEILQNVSNIDSVNRSFDQPNWVRIYSLVKLKYGKDYAKRSIMKGKIALYEFQIGANDNHPKIKDWISASTNKLLKYGTDLTVWQGISECNGIGWRTFLHSNDRQQLNNAIRIMSKALKSDANNEFRPKTQWDTYANLLYKVGRVSEAIEWQKRALADLAGESGSFMIKLNWNTGRLLKKCRGENQLI